MRQRLKNKTFKLSEDELYYLYFLKNKYHIKINQFVRNAIIEKLQRDMPEIRKEYLKNKNKEYCPF